MPGAAAAATATTDGPTLLARATLSADFLAPGPPSGALATPANGRVGPFPARSSPASRGMIDNGDGTFWAMPDNGFGTKANSADFLLRLYLITPDWETADGGPGRSRSATSSRCAIPTALDPVPDRQRRHAGAAADRRRLRHRVRRAGRRRQLLDR